ncbi:MAG: PKD domain-containing protein [Candidatus Thermoplasmatota archaeon]|nr:PKD domain-containing protein [Candidatus Thermoplasmatota archaeon]
MKKKILVLLLCGVVATGILGGCVEEANKAPVASFTYTPIGNIYVDTEISFSDTSTDEDGTVASWAWTFGDDTTSTEQNPTHAYTTVGEYAVSLIVTDNDGNASEPYTMTITVSFEPPTADFTYDPMVNIMVNTTTITFTDTSTAGDANITSWHWDFGDGENSTDQNTTHLYTAPGEYIVTLTVTDANEEVGTTSVTITVEEET